MVAVGVVLVLSVVPAEVMCDVPVYSNAWRRHDKGMSTDQVMVREPPADAMKYAASTLTPLPGEKAVPPLSSVIPPSVLSAAEVGTALLVQLLDEKIEKPDWTLL